MTTYPKTKESGVDWISVIPSHWETRKLKFLVSIKKDISGKLGPDVLSVTQRGIRIKDTTTGGGQLSMDYSKYQVVRTGDFVMNHMDLLTGFVDISNFEGVTSPDYRVFQITTSILDPNYLLRNLQLCYWFKIFYGLGQGVSNLGRWRLPTEVFENFRVPLPSLPEQLQIVSFLDLKTSLIDEIIENKTQRIELLKEMRSSLISEVVTKGLNPEVPMKDSGVEWIGEIPSHWDVVKTKFLSDNQDSKRVPLSSEERGSRSGPYPYWGSNGVIDQIDQYLFDGNIVLVGEDGSPFLEQFKDVSFFVNEPVWVNNHIHVLTPRGEILGRYLSSSFNIVEYSGFISGSTREKLTKSELDRISHPLPPLREQHQIVSVLDEKTSLIDEEISREERSIDYLKKFRKSLIHEVVTGKRDVRGGPSS